MQYIVYHDTCPKYGQCAGSSNINSTEAVVIVSFILFKYKISNVPLFNYVYEQSC